MDLTPATAQSLRKHVAKLSRLTLLAIPVCMLPGCEYDQAEANSSNSLLENKLDYLAWSESTVELEQYYGRRSLGEPSVQASDHLVFVQSFPNSGIRASHLYVYSSGRDGLFFVSFFLVPDIVTVKIKALDDGSVEVTCRDKRLAILDGVAGE